MPAFAPGVRPVFEEAVVAKGGGGEVDIGALVVLDVDLVVVLGVDIELLEDMMGCRTRKPVLESCAALGSYD
jgi:hypothetical protein